jgi:hypothetical protein
MPMPHFDPPPPWMRRHQGSATAEGPCASDPPAPAGYRVWTGRVPTELTQWAIDLLRTVNRYDYGTTWTMPFQGMTVLARKDHHTWTWRGGQLVTGICIPGITLYTPAPAAAGDAALSTYDVAKFSVETALDALSPLEVLLLGVLAGVLVDEIVSIGRRRRAA